MARIRLATIGTSAIVRTFLQAAADVPEIAVTTAFSRDPQRAVRFAAEAGIPHTSSDLPALLASGDIDAVYVASPNAIHFEQARSALDAGVHVLLEKPATPTAAEFETLVSTAREHSAVVLEAMRSAYDPAIAAVSDLVREVGPVRRASLGMCQRSARYDLVLAGETVNIFDPALAGGALYDLGVYCISAMVQLFGEPDRAVGASAPIATGADGAGAALAAYPEFVVDLSYSKITASDRPNEIQGELGTLTFDSVARPRWAELALLDGSRARHELAGPDNNMVFEVRRFAELVAGDRDASADHARALATLRVVDALRAHDARRL
ncbi:MAG: Gfo/Idh/MocA family oxidoreductase [Microbacterium sp.]|uniref:Gfo/Idh/MocA family protein n=1 Tax=Microbacterium sp. TaxID=51671 RepID=UPI0039E3C719